MTTINKIRTEPTLTYLRVSSLIAEIAHSEYVHNSMDFISRFKKQIKEMDANNTFPPSAMYQAIEINIYETQIYKLKATGELNYLLTVVKFKQDGTID